MANTKALNPPHLLKKIVPNILKCRNIGGNKAEGDEAGFSFVVQTTNAWKRRLSMFRLEVFEALVNPKLRLRCCHSNASGGAIIQRFLWTLGGPLSGRSRESCHACSVNA
jgi:hypothetical protein